MARNLVPARFTRAPSYDLTCARLTQALPREFIRVKGPDLIGHLDYRFLNSNNLIPLGGPKGHYKVVGLRSISDAACLACGEAIVFNNCLATCKSRRLRKLANLFYHYCGKALCPFALPEFEQDERVEGGTHLSLISTNLKVLGDVKDD
ncbi:hypothetical protein GOBAR_DD03768 [Gossypium barbadense]|nr:hypothetical protein GOBAR_DD03768 [Gossypium barbadense]